MARGDLAGAAQPGQILSTRLTGMAADRQFRVPVRCRRFASRETLPPFSLSTPELPELGGAHRSESAQAGRVHHAGWQRGRF